MPVLSAGLLMCRLENKTPQFFLVHPGGPFYVRKNEGVWSIPKGIVSEGEELMHAAQREFEEETGLKAVPPFQSLGSCKLKSGKIIHAWAFLGEWDGTPVQSNVFDLQWPPNSGKFIQVPEVDKAAWFSFEEANAMINPHQKVFLERALQLYQPNG
jgi:predicted NUDIX family NTP pyrophosphohydrolase